MAIENINTNNTTAELTNTNNEEIKMNTITENTNNTPTVSDDNNSKETTEFSKEDKEIRNETQRRFTSIQNNRKTTLKEKIEFAKYLLEMKKKLQNEFYKVITKDIISRKQVGRYIKLILTTDSKQDYAKGMCHRGKNPDEIEKKLDLLVEDVRVASLTVEQIDTMPEPTTVSIEKAQEAETHEEFLKAIAGDKDTLDAIRDKKSAVSKTKKETEEIAEQERLEKLKPANMENDTYQDLLKKEKATLISLLQAQIDENESYKKELVDLREVTKQAGLYNPNKQNHKEEA